MSTCEFGGIRIDDLTLQEAAARIERLATVHRRGYVVTPNAYHLALLGRDPEFLKAYRDAELVLPDSHWLVLASRAAGCRLRERCAGSDLFPLVLDVARRMGISVFLLGGTNGSEQIASAKIRREFGLEVRSYSPPFGFHRDPVETDRILDMINDSGADLLFLHVGAPKSELWVHEHINRLDISLAFCFGMALEYYAGTVRRAPRIMQALGLEWLFRLCQEPARLWRRYTFGSINFIALAAREVVRKRLIGKS